MKFLGPNSKRVQYLDLWECSGNPSTQADHELIDTRSIFSDPAFLSLYGHDLKSIPSLGVSGILASDLVAFV